MGPKFHWLQYSCCKWPNSSHKVKIEFSAFSVHTFSERDCIIVNKVCINTLMPTVPPLIRVLLRNCCGADMVLCRGDPLGIPLLQWPSYKLLKFLPRTFLKSSRSGSISAVLTNRGGENPTSAAIAYRSFHQRQPENPSPARKSDPLTSVGCAVRLEEVAGSILGPASYVS